jgi:hypothetical protein
MVSFSDHCVWNRPGPLLLHSWLPTCSRADYNPWNPWSHRPRCAHASDRSDADYCSFTFLKFRGGLGVTLTTSPDIALGAIRLLEDPDPVWAPELEGMFSSEPLKFEVRDIPGKGKGAVVNHTIRTGEVIIREFPVMIDTTKSLPKSVNPAHARRVLEQGFRQLPNKTQARILDMAQTRKGHVIEGILRTNVFGITINGEEHSGLYPEIAVRIATLSSCARITLP